MKPTIEEAFIGVLACVRVADGSFPDSERETLHVLCRHHAITRHLDEQQYQTFVAAVKKQVQAETWQQALAAYLKVLPRNYGPTVLMCAADLALADIEQDEAELHVLRIIGGHFEITAERMEATVSWFRVKHGMPQSEEAEKQRA